MTSHLALSQVPVAVPHVVSASGCTLRTADGREYTDLESGVWCTVLGHQHPAVSAAVVERLESVVHLGYRAGADVVEAAAHRLCEITGLRQGKALLLSSGSEAVDLAVRAALEVTGRSLLLRLPGTYLSAYGPGGLPAHGSWMTTDELDSLHPGARQNALGRVAAFVVEPGNASGLVDLPDADLVRRTAAEVRAAGGLVVADEVTTGFGRTGRWFGYEHCGVVPEVVAVGKGAGNGFPVSGVVMSREVAEQVRRSDLRYAQSHQDDPFGAAVLLAVADAIEHEGLLAAARARGDQLLRGLRDVASRSDGVRHVRGRGLLCAFTAAPGQALAIQAALLERGFLVGAHGPSDTVRVYPPLVVAEAEVAGFLAAVADVVG